MRAIFKRGVRDHMGSVNIPLSNVNEFYLFRPLPWGREITGNYPAKPTYQAELPLLNLTPLESVERSNSRFPPDHPLPSLETIYTRSS